MDPLFDRHNFVYMNKKIDYPLIKNEMGDIVRGLVAGALTGGVTGNVVAGMVGAACGYIGGGATNRIENIAKDLINPFRRNFSFHTSDFVLMRGYRKNIDGDFATAEFELVDNIHGQNAKLTVMTG